jgi:hypothetical protein
MALGFGPTSVGRTGPHSPDAEWWLPVPLPVASAEGRAGATDLRGLEVHPFDETRIGAVVAVAETDLAALDPRLGFGRRCLATPLGRVRPAAEGRLLLDMTAAEFRAAVCIEAACGA